jgi:hypothetical protein
LWGGTTEPSDQVLRDRWIAFSRELNDSNVELPDVLRRDVDKVLGFVQDRELNNDDMYRPDAEAEEWAEVGAEELFGEGDPSDDPI